MSSLNDDALLWLRKEQKFDVKMILFMIHSGSVSFVFETFFELGKIGFYVRAGYPDFFENGFSKVFLWSTIDSQHEWYNSIMKKYPKK